MENKKPLISAMKSRAYLFDLAPREGFEPPTDRLTADCSTTELPRKDGLPIADSFAVLKPNLPHCVTKFKISFDSVSNALVSQLCRG